ncbi:MAG: hypothetical protein JWL77_4179 [Chthonomonadaceae bacterium]|nr:hypothetical protein [Chthonomonadaceae bacterium]
MPPPNIESVFGVVNYESPVAAALIESDGTNSLLIIDKPPIGNINVEDVAAAASFLHNFLGLPAGASLVVHGIRVNLNRPALLIVRVN